MSGDDNKEDREKGGRLGRLLAGARSLANALLDLGLPTIKEWLRARLGPVADVEAVVTEGSLLHLDRVTIPIGPRGLLTLARATCALSRGARVGLPTVRLHAFDGGLLRFGGPGEPSFAADVSFTADASPSEEAWVAGRLAITNATWTAGAAAREDHTPMTGSARLVVTSSGWSLDDGELRTDSAEVKFTGAGPLVEDAEPLQRAHMTLRDARARHFLDAVTALTGAPLAVELPREAGDPTLSGEGAWDARGLGGSSAPVGRCDLRIEAELLALALRGTITRKDGTLAVDGKLEGDVHVAKVMGSLGVPETAWPEPEDTLRVDLAVTGSPARPSVTGTARAETMRFRAGRPRFEPLLVVRSVAFDVVTDDQRLTLSGGLAIGSGGAGLSLRGELPFAPSLEKLLVLGVESLDATTIAAIVRAGGLGAMIGLEGKDAASTFSVPLHTRASGELELRLRPQPEGLTIDGAMAFETPRSALELAPLRWSGGDAAGTRLRGGLALADALIAGLFPTDVRPTDGGVMTGDLAISGPAGDLVLDGQVAAGQVEIEIASRPEVPPYAFESIAGRLRITRRSILYDDAVATGYGGSFHLAGEAPFEGGASPSGGGGRPPSPPPPSALTYPDRLHVRIDNADACFLEALGNLATGGLAVRRERRGDNRRKDEVWIPAGARLCGEARLDDAMRLRADVALEHGETVLLGTLALSPAPELRVDGSEIRGRLSVADALLAGAFDTSMQPLPEGAPRIEATLKGRIDDVVISGLVTADRVRIGMRGSPKIPAFTLTDLSAMFRIDRAKIVWHKLVARAYDGSISSSGLVGYAEAFTGIRSSVDWADVAAEQIPVDPTGRELAGKFVRGRLSGRMRFERVGPDDRPVVGHGNVTVASPEYPAVELASGMLARYGLSPPNARGTNPLTFGMELGQLGWSFGDLDARLQGCSATGSVSIGFDNGVNGHFVVTLDRSYLSQSTLLTLPAAFAGQIEIPVRVIGWLPKPPVEADFAGAFGRLMSQNRVTSFIDEAVDDVYAVFRGRSPAPSAAAPPPEVDDNPHPAEVDEDAIVREMIASGADWDEIEWRLAELRKGGPRFRVE